MKHEFPKNKWTGFHICSVLASHHILHKIDGTQFATPSKPLEELLRIIRFNQQVVRCRLRGRDLIDNIHELGAFANLQSTEDVPEGTHVLINSQAGHRFPQSNPTTLACARLLRWYPFLDNLLIGGAQAAECAVRGGLRVCCGATA